MLAIVQSALAQNSQNEIIWCSVVVARYGDRTPIIEPGDSVLTSLGAQQLFSAGGLYRDRYVSPRGNNRSTVISGISSFQIENNQASGFS